jgi:hypothetical protein
VAKASETLLSKDGTRIYGTNLAVRCSLFKAEMRAVRMMVANILGEQSLQMAFIWTSVIAEQW